MQKISTSTQKEIKSILTCSSCNCISFDERTDLNVRALIDECYKDFLLDFIYLSEEINDAAVLAKIVKYFYILACTTDNCNLMARTAEFLDLWRIPCVLHLLNLIFQLLMRYLMI